MNNGITGATLTANYRRLIEEMGKRGAAENPGRAELEFEVACALESAEAARSDVSRERWLRKANAFASALARI